MMDDSIKNSFRFASWVNLDDVANDDEQGEGTSGAGGYQMFFPESDLVKQTAPAFLYAKPS